MSQAMDTEPDPIPFCSWLRSAEAALAEEQPAEVPCGDCNACCRTSHVIHVRPEEKRTRALIPRRALLSAPGLPPGNFVIGYDGAGCCPLLVGGRCSIYKDRPLACRTFDCRIYAAAGIVADRAAIARQVERWRFTYPSQDDHDRQAAVQAAARYIRQHPECLASAAVSHDPLRVAVLAIAVHEKFLEGVAVAPSWSARVRGPRIGLPGRKADVRGRGAGGPGRGADAPGRELSARVIARAVVAANERLFGDW